jgi:hypothetical protein
MPQTHPLAAELRARSLVLHNAHPQTETPSPFGDAEQVSGVGRLLRVFGRLTRVLCGPFPEPEASREDGVSQRVSAVRGQTHVLDRFRVVDLHTATVVDTPRVPALRHGMLEISRLLELLRSFHRLWAVAEDNPR